MKKIVEMIIGWSYIVYIVMLAVRCWQGETFLNGMLVFILSLCMLVIWFSVLGFVFLFPFKKIVFSKIKRGLQPEKAMKILSAAFYVYAALFVIHGFMTLDSFITKSP